jgi:hypothetical protein
LLRERGSQLAGRRGWILHLKSLAESISRQLRKWAGSLQELPIKGQRYLTEAVRQGEQKRKEQEEFLALLERIVKEGQKQRAAQGDK